MSYTLRPFGKTGLCVVKALVLASQWNKSNWEPILCVVYYGLFAIEDGLLATKATITLGRALYSILTPKPAQGGCLLSLLICHTNI